MFPKKKWAKNKKDRIARDSVKADKAEEKLWKWFSKYIRLRDCPTGSHGFARCITCGKIYDFREMDCGHYIKRKWKSVKYDETNNHAQCTSCNSYEDGEVAKYRIAIIEKYGEDAIIDLEERSREIFKKPYYAEVEALATYYRIKAKEEAERVGVIIK